MIYLSFHIPSCQFSTTMRTRKGGGSEGGPARRRRPAAISRARSAPLGASRPSSAALHNCVLWSIAPGFPKEYSPGSRCGCSCVLLNGSGERTVSLVRSHFAKQECLSTPFLADVLPASISPRHPPVPRSPPLRRLRGDPQWRASPHSTR